jgi:hypothetical protein
MSIHDIDPGFAARGGGYTGKKFSNVALSRLKLSTKQNKVGYFL